MSFEWAVDRSGLPPLLPGNPPTADDIAAAARQEAAVALAVQVMHHLSGRQFGIRTVTVRPCRQPLHTEYRGDSAATSYVVSWEGDHWINLTCGCYGGCRLTGPRMVHLPGPVHSVDEVTIAAAEIDPSGYVLENDVLYRVGGPWPRQDLGRPAGESNTWSVKYLRGIECPAGVDILTGILAKEFLTAVTTNGQCRLPRTVTAASRQGVTYRVYDPAVIYANGKTGLPEIDMWLAAVNPNHLMAAPSVR